MCLLLPVLLSMELGLRYHINQSRSLVWPTFEMWGRSDKTAVATDRHTLKWFNSCPMLYALQNSTDKSEKHSFTT